MTDAKITRRDLGAHEYLGTAFDPSDRLAVLVRNRHRGETLQRITTAGKIMEPAFQDWLHFKNDREGFDVYVGMNPLKPGARSRTKDDILSIRHLYVDLDHEGPTSLAAIEQSNLVPRPNYVLTTSANKFQVVWRVADISQEHAEALLRAMARRFGADPAATDSTRILRLPGFLNRKYEEDILVKAEERTDRVNHPLDFRIRIEHVESSYEPARRVPAMRSSRDARPLSQSEHDWAFAKRALARGAEPEEVIRSIVQFREGDKHDVLDYARRTVTKAQAELRQETSAQDSDGRTPESV